MAEMTTWPCMFSLHLPLTRFFQLISVKMISFGLASKARILLHYSHLCNTNFFKKLMFAVCRKCNSQSLYCLSITQRPTHLTTTTKSCTMGHYKLLVLFIQKIFLALTYWVLSRKLKYPCSANQVACFTLPVVSVAVSCFISLTTPFPGSSLFLPWDLGKRFLLA